MIEKVLLTNYILSGCQAFKHLKFKTRERLNVKNSRLFILEHKIYNTHLFYYAYALIIQSSVWITDQAEKDKLISEFKKNTG